MCPAYCKIVRVFTFRVPCRAGQPLAVHSCAPWTCSNPLRRITVTGHASARIMARGSQMGIRHLIRSTLGRHDRRISEIYRKVIADLGHFVASVRDDIPSPRIWKTTVATVSARYALRAPSEAGDQ
jgi:hypothetical protein